MKEEEILRIIESYERTTYPRGVGSVFRCIESEDYRSLAQALMKSLSTLTATNAK